MFLVSLLLLEQKLQHCFSQTTVLPCFEQDGLEFFSVEGNLDFDSARELCLENDGELATLTTGEQMDFISSELNGFFFIGIVGFTCVHAKITITISCRII